MRKTKIVCTLGPACDSEPELREMCLAGMDVARLNFSHGTQAEHLERIRLIKKLRRELGRPIAIMLDTKGPEYRSGRLKNGPVTLREGDEFTFTVLDVPGDEKRVSVSYAGLARDLAAGDRILVNNGLLEFLVERIEGTELRCRVLAGGVLSDRKSMSFPGKVLRQEYLSEQDKSDILFGIEHGVDFIACSFVSRRQDMLDVRSFVDAHGGDVELIAKIENQPGIDNIDEICSECSGIMIGRGDMGVEVAFEELPAIQKYLITRCRLLGKRVITATEMLESMITNIRPTRAEISDVANAVYDGSSAVMLSGETAAGKHPALTVRTMARIAESTEQSIFWDKRFRDTDFTVSGASDAVSHATCSIALDIGARAIAVCTVSGATARLVSRFRCPVDILGVTPNPRSYQRMALSWGVTPVMCEELSTAAALFATAREKAAETFDLRAGDQIVITCGQRPAVSGGTDLLKIERV